MDALEPRLGVRPIVDPNALRERRQRNAILAGRIVFLSALLVVWQILGPHLDKIVFSSPGDVAARLGQWVGGGSLWPHLVATLEEVALGYALGCAIGIVVGFIMGSNEVVAGIFDPLVMAFYGLPKIALAPLFVVWFGINLAPKVVLAAVLVFFLVFFSTYHGVREVDPDLLNTVRLLGATPGQVRRWVIMPSALSAIFLGLKMAVPEALVGAVIGELIVSSRGIGYLAEYSASQLDTAGVFAALVVLSVLALLANGFVNLASRREGRKAA